MIGDDQAQQYFARGITADLIAQLSRLSGLQVVAAIAEPNPPMVRIDTGSGVRSTAMAGCSI